MKHSKYAPKLTELLNLLRKPSIDPQLTAHQWGLYDLPESKTAAEALNRTLKSCINSGLNKKETLLHIERVSSLYAHTGMWDAEVQARIYQALLIIFEQ